jgi:hypothetical protein
METSAIDHKKAEIIAKAWGNPDYKRQLLADPKAVIASEFVVDIPAGIDIKVLEDTLDIAHLVLVQPGFLPETDQPTIQMGVIAKAWDDPAFKAALLADPRVAFSKYFQYQLPAKPALKVVEQTDTSLYIVIPQRPASLSDAELDQVAGGMSKGNEQLLVDGAIVGGLAIVCPEGEGAIVAGFALERAYADRETIAKDGTVAGKWIGHAGQKAGHAIGHAAKKVFHGW